MLGRSLPINLRTHKASSPLIRKTKLHLNRSKIRTPRSSSSNHSRTLKKARVSKSPKATPINLSRTTRAACRAIKSQPSTTLPKTRSNIRSKLNSIKMDQMAVLKKSKLRVTSRKNWISTMCSPNLWIQMDRAPSKIKPNSSSRWPSRLSKATKGSSSLRSRGCRMWLASLMLTRPMQQLLLNHRLPNSSNSRCSRSLLQRSYRFSKFQKKLMLLYNRTMTLPTSPRMRDCCSRRRSKQLPKFNRWTSSNNLNNLN